MNNLEPNDENPMETHGVITPGVVLTAIIFLCFLAGAAVFFALYKFFTL
jgi:hypothetical protein